jgi:hypothetical protein
MDDDWEDCGATEPVDPLNTPEMRRAIAEAVRRALEDMRVKATPPIEVKAPEPPPPIEVKAPEPTPAKVAAKKRVVLTSM